MHTRCSLQWPSSTHAPDLPTTTTTTKLDNNYLPSILCRKAWRIRDKSRAKKYTSCITPSNTVFILSSMVSICAMWCKDVWTLYYIQKYHSSLLAQVILYYITCAARVLCKFIWCALCTHSPHATCIDNDNNTVCTCSVVVNANVTSRWLKFLSLVSSWVLFEVWMLLWFIP